MAFVIPAALSLMITPWVIRLAHRVGAIDLPNERKAHSKPTPRLGGVAIFISFFVSLWIILSLDQGLFSTSWIRGGEGALLVVSLLLVLVLGIWDDIRTLKPGQKLLIQILLGTIVYLSGIRLSSITNPFGPGLLDLGFLNYPATLLWIVGITNAINLIDGLDGLASGVTIIACLTIFAISLLTNDAGTALLAFLMAGAVLGFLRYNFNPARIFLGDSGSLFLGLTLAVLSIQSSTKGSTAFAILIPVLALGLPIMDTLLSMVRRFLHSFLPQNSKSESFARKLESMFVPDRSHIHHQLLKRGFSHRDAVLLLYLVACVFGSVAFAVTVTNNFAASVILVAVGTATIVGIRQLRYREIALLQNGVFLQLYDRPLLNRALFQAFLDLGFIIAAYTGVHFLSVWLGNSLPGERQFFTTLVIVAGVQLGVFWISGLYRSTFRQLGIGDVIKITKTVAVAQVATAVVLALVPYETSYTGITAHILGFYFLLSLVIGSRVSFHVLKYLSQRASEGKKRVLIYGADPNGTLILQRMLDSDTSIAAPVGFLDDNPRLEGKYLNGYPIYGGHWKLQQLSRRMKIDEMIICSDHVKPEILSRLKHTAANERIVVKRANISLEDLPITRDEARVSRQPPKSVLEAGQASHKVFSAMNLVSSK
jgi:UDP-GlcNAc:undecaprenyl-phosphate GlcNAc-1-phosphate transferase